MGMFDIFREIEKQTALPMKRYSNRLAGLEDTIMIARPDFCEAAESVLAPLMAALEKRYDHRESASYQQMGEVKDYAKKLFDALMKADEAEEQA